MSDTEQEPSPKFFRMLKIFVAYNALLALTDGLHRVTTSEKFRHINNFLDFDFLDIHAWALNKLNINSGKFAGWVSILLSLIMIFLILLIHSFERGFVAETQRMRKAQKEITTAKKMTAQEIPKSDAPRPRPSPAAKKPQIQKKPEVKTKPSPAEKKHEMKIPVSSSSWPSRIGITTVIPFLRQGSGLSQLEEMLNRLTISEASRNALWKAALCCPTDMAKFLETAVAVYGMSTNSDQKIYAARMKDFVESGLILIQNVATNDFELGPGDIDRLRTAIAQLMDCFEDFQDSN